MGLTLGTNLTFFTNVSKRLKLKVRTFWGLIPTFVEVTGEKLVGSSRIALKSYKDGWKNNASLGCNFFWKSHHNFSSSFKVCHVFNHNFSLSFGASYKHNLFLKTADYLKILANKEVNHFVVINSGKCFKSLRQKLYSELGEEKNLIKVVGSFYTFLATAVEVEKYVELIEQTPLTKIMMQSGSSDDCLHHYIIKILNLLNV